MAASGRTNPTLLTFHGSGSNETIHTVQLARVARILKLHFEFESLNGMSLSAQLTLFPYLNLVLLLCPYANPEIPHLLSIFRPYLSFINLPPSTPWLPDNQIFKTED